MIRSVVVKGAETVARNMEKTRRQASRDIEIVTRKVAFGAERQWKKRYSGRDLKPRSGTLRRSVNTRKIHGFRERSRYEVGTPVKYSRPHDVGAVIRPKNRGREVITGRRADGTLRTKRALGRRLLIPLAAAKTRAGVVRDVHLDQVALALSRGAPFTTWVSKSGRALLMRVGNGDIQVIGALVSQVRIRGRKTSERVARTADAALVRLMNKRLKRNIRKNGGA